MEEKDPDQALNQLRLERKAFVDRVKQNIKTQQRIIKAIKQQIKHEAKTVPEIAAATQICKAQVLLYIATLRKYGKVLEGEKDGAYFKYRLAG